MSLSFFGSKVRLSPIPTDKSLIQRNSEGQYEIPEILRQYGAEKLDTSEETAVLSRHTSYLTRFLRVRESAAVIVAAVSLLYPFPARA